MRRFFFLFVLVSLFILFICGCACADAVIYRGARSIGAVQSIENNSVTFVPVEDVGRLFGFSASRSTEEVLLVKGNTKLRVIFNSAAAWRDFSIVPLYSAPFERDGRCWIDTSSAVSLFQAFAGAGQDNRLRFNRIAGASVASSAKSDIDFGSFEEKSEKKYEEKSGEKTVAQNTAQPFIIIPQVPVQPRQTTQPVTAAKAPVQVTTVQVAAAGAPAQKQPKYETFKITDSKTDKNEIYSGTVQGIRWTSQEGTHKKIRAVIMVDDEAETEVFMSGRALHALFASSLENSDAFNSPFENIKTEVKRNAQGLEVLFKAERITKAEKIILSNPKRIVLDFFFPAGVNLVRTAPAKTQQTVAQQKTVQTQRPVVQPVQPVQKQEPAPKKADPIIIINNKNNKPKQADKTKNPVPVPVAASTPKRSARKTVVVDPGHGGKDPGASDNGVVEKNVNLGIGLELEKVLTARGYNVVMTRRTDVYLKLQERTDIANNVNADLFVSIHVNALPAKKTMTGFEIYIMALPTDKDAMNLAKIENREYVEGKGVDVANVDRRTEMLLHILGDMQQNNKISESTSFAAALYNAGVRNNLPMRRVAQAPFFVLRGAGMPAVLLETGFVTNAAESKLLTTSAYQQKIANAMAEGISNYIK